MLTDNGSQYVTWRGTSAFHREMDKRGIKQIVAKPQRPQTLGKIERFWGTLWRECIETAVFLDLEDARRRIGHFIDYYNFQRPHQGIDGLVPADRFFGAASEVLQTLRKRVAANALELARNGVPKAPFYVTGRIGDRAFSVHAEGERMILKREGQTRTRGRSDGAGSRWRCRWSPWRASKPADMPLPVCPDGSPHVRCRRRKRKCPAHRPWTRGCGAWTRRSLADNRSRKMTRRNAMTTNRDVLRCPPRAMPTGVVLKGRRPGRPAEPREPISREAQRFAAAILEVLAGVRTPTDAAAALGISVPRYYLWEQRALGRAGSRLSSRGRWARASAQRLSDRWSWKRRSLG